MWPSWLARPSPRTAAPGQHRARRSRRGARKPHGHNRIPGFRPVVATWAVYDPVGLGTVGAPLTATPTGSGFRLDGVKDRVEAGAESAGFSWWRACDGEVRQFLVRRMQPACGSNRNVDRPGEGYARVISMVSRSTRLPRSDRPSRPRSRSRARARSRGASMCRDRRHPRRRAAVHHPVGLRPTLVRRPLGSYQALKHRYADLKIWFEACRAATNAAVKEVAGRSDRRGMAVSVAKSYVGEHAPRMLQDCTSYTAVSG